MLPWQLEPTIATGQTLFTVIKQKELKNWREIYSIIVPKNFNTGMSNTWSDEETKLLISLWSDQNIQEQLENHSIRNKVVYAKLADGMIEGGFNRNAKQCESKIKHLKEKYRSYKDKIAKSGAGASKKPKFFEEVDQVLGTRPQTRPSFVLDSGNFEASDSRDSESPVSEIYGKQSKKITEEKMTMYSYIIFLFFKSKSNR